jgi:Na+-driven multidrug efflux pump
MTFSIWVSALAFFVVEGYVLQDQLAIGHAGGIFILGTAGLIAGACIGLFALLMAIGLAISAVFSSEEPGLQQSRDFRGVAAASGQTGPPPDTALAPARAAADST